ncbi:MAG: protein kinase domain-containing protein [Blastocatellia bacterium]
MTPDRWKKLDALFHEALGFQGEARGAHLAKVCGADEQLRAEAEKLIAAHERESSFIDSPILAEAAELSVDDRREFLVGRCIGHYQVISLLGRGGMGEVFLAEDSKLNRKVALKVLPAAFTQNPDRVRRFEREAKAASATNHPNILTIYEIGQAEGLRFIATEFIDGVTLRQPMQSDGMSIAESLSVAVQVASALSAAHETGIIHRDIKPENVMVRPDGLVKVLDFGLAKLTERTASAPEVDSQAETIARLSTEPGVVMGTVSYMSPEQARGDKADHRTDIFSLGVMLYEMIAGRRPFAGATLGETIAAILRDEPPELSETNAKVSPQLEKVVRRCLEKKPERRFQSASDLGFALETLSAPASSAGMNRMDAAPAIMQTAKRGGWRDRIAWIVAGVLGLALLAVSVAYFKRSSAEPRAVRLAFVPPENLAFDNGLNDRVVVSPDGQKLVFTGQSADGRRQLWVRQFDAAEAQPLPGTDDPLNPFWSPDSRSIGFGSQGKLKRIDLTGGRPKTLYDAFNLGGTSGSGTWSSTGVILFAHLGCNLLQIPASGGEAQPLTISDPALQGRCARFPYFLPDGRRFLFRAGNDVFAGSLDSKEVKQVLTDAAPAVYAPPGWLLFVLNGALLAQSFDAERLELKGDAFPLTQPTNNARVFGLPLSVSDNGVLIWQGDRGREYQLVWFGREGKQTGTVGPPIKVTLEQAPRLSPDGRRVAIHRIDPQTRNCDIWVIDLLRNLPTRLTSDPLVDQMPTWSPDGARLVFNSSKGGVNGLYQKAASGVGAEELLLEGGIDPTDWSTDGRFIIFSRATEKNRRDVWALPLTGSRQPSPLLNSDFDEYRAQLSPDGHWLAYVSDESGSYEIYAQKFTAEGKLGGDKKRISTSGGNHPRFRRDGRELFYVAADGQMMAVGIKTSGATFEFETPKALFKTRIQRGQTHQWIEYDVTADGQRFLIGTMIGEAPPASVILNWTAAVRW